MEEFNNSSPETDSPENQTADSGPPPVAVPIKWYQGWRNVLIANILVYLISAMILILVLFNHAPGGGEIVVAMVFAFPVVILLDLAILPFALFTPRLKPYRTRLVGCIIVVVLLALFGFLVISVLSGID